MSANDDPREKPLTPEQVAFFKDNGYLLLPGALDLELCAWARARLWETLPPEVALQRDDPATHVGPPHPLGGRRRVAAAPEAVEDPGVQSFAGAAVRGAVTAG